MGRFLVILCLLCGGAAYAGEAPLTPREKALFGDGAEVGGAGNGVGTASGCTTAVGV